jgi:phosphoserine phosphatase
VVAFDLDGTLLPGTSVTQWLADQLGHGKAIEALEKRFRAREISNSVIADASAAWLKGLSRREIWSLLEQAPWIGGIGTAVEALRRHGQRVLLASISWTVAGEFLQARYPFEAICGTEMETVGEILAGRVARYFDEHDKVAFVEAVCHRIGCTLDECIAVGDSRSDVPLFKRAGFSVALNATADAQAAARVSLQAGDLRPVVDVILAQIATRLPSQG